MRSSLKKRLLCCYFCSFTGVLATEIKLPDLGTSQGTAFSKKEESLIGQSWMHRNFYSQSKMQRDYILQEYLEQMVQRLATLTRIGEDVTVLVFENKQFNAFAVPGNIIGINTGLILRLGTESALAGVVAHELSHLSQQHISRSIEASKGQNLTLLMGLLATIAFALNNEGDAAISSLLLSQGIAQAALLKYSRNQELEADRIGLNILKRSGYDPYGMVDAHKVISSLQARSRSKIPDYLLTHPLSSRRISDARLGLQNDKKQQNYDNLLFRIVQINAKFYHEHPYDLVREYRKRQDFNPKSFSFKYGLAKALIDHKKPLEAQPLIAQLLKKERDNAAFFFLYLQELSLLKKYEAAKKAAAEWLQKNKNSYAILMQYAEVCKQSGDYQMAIEILQRVVKNRKTDIVVWYDLAEVYGLSGDLYQTSRARAEYFFLTGLYQPAIKQLEIAKSYVATNPKELAQLDFRITEIIEFILFAQKLSK